MALPERKGCQDFNIRERIENFRDTLQKKPYLRFDHTFISIHKLVEVKQNNFTLGLLVSSSARVFFFFFLLVVESTYLPDMYKQKGNSLLLICLARKLSSSLSSQLFFKV